VLVDVIVLVDVLVHVHVLVAVIGYPYPSGYGTAIGGTAKAAAMSDRAATVQCRDRREWVVAGHWNN